MSDSRPVSVPRGRESPPVFARPAVRPAVGLRPLFGGVSRPSPPPRASWPCARPSAVRRRLPIRFRLAFVFPFSSHLLLVRRHLLYCCSDATLPTPTAASSRCDIVDIQGQQTTRDTPWSGLREGRRREGVGAACVWDVRRDAPGPARSPRRHWQVAGPSGPGRHWTYRPPSLRGGGVQACAPRKPRPGPRSGVVVWSTRPALTAHCISEC